MEGWSCLFFWRFAGISSDTLQERHELLMNSGEVGTNSVIILFKNDYRYIFYSKRFKIKVVLPI
jgi:hypothetical protein